MIIRLLGGGAKLTRHKKCINLYLRCTLFFRLKMILLPKTA